MEPDTALADCLKSCGLTVADLEEANMIHIIHQTLSLPGSRYKEFEDFVKNVEHRLKFFQTASFGRQKPTAEQVKKLKLETLRNLEVFKQKWSEESQKFPTQKSSLSMQDSDESLIELLN